MSYSPPTRSCEATRGDGEGARFGDHPRHAPDILSQFLRGSSPFWMLVLGLRSYHLGWARVGRPSGLTLEVASDDRRVNMALSRRVFPSRWNPVTHASSREHDKGAIDNCNFSPSAQPLNPPLHLPQTDLLEKSTIPPTSASQLPHLPDRSRSCPVTTDLGGRHRGMPRRHPSRSLPRRRAGAYPARPNRRHRRFR